MPERKRVFITVNPDLIAGKRLSTVRSIVSALDPICDLKIAPVDQYDFKSGQVMTYGRLAGGYFEKQGLTKPSGDLWIVYSDGYWLDHIDQGFTRREDFLHAQLTLHEKSVSARSITTIMNNPQAERNCLKDWLAGLDFQSFKIIPTYRAGNFSEVCDLIQNYGILVAKPNWGGSGQGITKVACQKDVMVLKNLLEESGSNLSEYCFQVYVSGAEKRLWYVGGKCVAARITRGRHTPWSADSADFNVVSYDSSFGLKFNQDKFYADSIAKKAQLDFGSVDFIGDQINEINGAGTTFLQYHGFKKIVDARAQLVNFLRKAAME